MPDELIFEGHDLEELSLQLRAAADLYEREITPTMGLIGKEVEAAAKSIAGKRSSKVAATIKSHTIPGAAVVEAGDDATPIAMLWQVGNKGRGHKGTFRHSVYGHRDLVVEQPMFRYMTEALRVTRRVRTQILERAWERILRMIESRV